MVLSSIENDFRIQERGDTPFGRKNLCQKGGMNFIIRAGENAETTDQASHHQPKISCCRIIRSGF